jgi:hypothetical protein
LERGRLADVCAAVPCSRYFNAGLSERPRLGAAIYNLAHTYALPAALAAYGLYQSQPLALNIALVWIAHIGFDRLLGFGLKYQTAFRHTHLSA